MPSLTSMAETILAQAKKLDAYLESNDIAYPSFDEDTLDQLPNRLQDDRWALANSTNELKKLARGAAMGTMDTAFNVCSSPFPRPWISTLVGVANCFGRRVSTVLAVFEIRSSKAR